MAYCMKCKRDHRKGAALHRAHYSSLNVHKERNKDGNWSFHLGKMKIQSAKHKSKRKSSSSLRIDNPRMKHLGGKCVMCGKKIPKSNFLCARCGRYDTAHTKYMRGETNTPPKW
jgi:hypothetical protein